MLKASTLQTANLMAVELDLDTMADLLQQIFGSGTYDKHATH